MNKLAVIILWALVSTNAHCIEVKNKVVFIYQADPSNNIEYYYNAQLYYSSIKEYLIVNNLKSLQAIHKWLYESAQLRQSPWKEVHIVSHGSFRKGLSIPVMEGRKKPARGIIDFSEIDGFSRLPASIINTKTKISIHACGIGKHLRTMSGLKKLFINDKNEHPNLTASKGYQFYERDAVNNKKVNGFEIPFVNILISKSLEWDLDLIVEELKNENPSLKINWRQAIKNQTRYDPKNPFTYKETFSLSVLAYKEDLQRVGSISKYFNVHPQVASVFKDQLIIGKIQYSKVRYSEKLVKLKTELISLKIFTPLNQIKLPD